MWLQGTIGGSAKLTVEGRVTVQNNNLMIGHRSTGDTFVTAHNFEPTVHIDIYPDDYIEHKDTLLVKVTGTQPLKWKNLFTLVKIPADQTWKLEKNSAGTELILRKD